MRGDEGFQGNRGAGMERPYVVIGGIWLSTSEPRHCSQSMVLISVAYACHGDARQDRVGL